MKNLKFNTLYIIESLRADDAKTGYALYEDLKLQEYFHEHVKVCYHSILTAQQWDNLMNEILKDCAEQEIYPIMHLEIHGDKTGIQFSNGETRSRDEVGEQLRNINAITGCNLFLTLGVCKGLYVLFNTHIDKPMPFCGAIGSFDKMLSGDIQLRYSAFYGTFFQTFDITKAYVQLMKTDTDVPKEYTHYRYIHVDEIFYNVYQKYLTENCDSEGMKERALQAANENNLKLLNRAKRRKFQQDFIREEKKRRLAYYNQARKAFFMLDEFPENEDRFEVPKTFKELEEKCKHLKTL